MAAMYLTHDQETGEERDVALHQEVEMMFENYLMQVTRHRTDRPSP
jgi:5-methylcytosine-specific restriction endonuclease McrBC regulatory subunit McrC